MPPSPEPFDYLPHLPAKRDYGIGVVGAGSIARAGHLPAYRSAGFHVVGVYDEDSAKAASLAADFEIAAFASLEALLESPEVAVVDIATPTITHPPLVDAAIAAGKHVLCQKPLTYDIAKAESMVRDAANAGVRLAVNQNGRWDQAFRSVYALQQRGDLGDLTYVQIDRVGPLRWELWPWLWGRPRVLIVEDAIHFLDIVRFILGEPEWLFADGFHAGDERIKGETSAIITLAWPGGAHGLLLNHAGIWDDDTHATYRFEGTEGVAKGDLGVFYNFPYGREDTLTYRSQSYGEDWISPELQGKWIPDALVGPMAELFAAIQEDREPMNSGADNLRTLCLVEAAYESIAERRAVRPRTPPAM
ncbi:MAG: Gfo/Idh/MocA family oxidoreductase [Chloroflexi bacterium]|nr:Gfo/Idh/MocA family oxidoreductase [Chloroflexota bacterium]